MKKLLAILLALATPALGIDRSIPCDGTDCAVRIYSRVGSTLTESAAFIGGGFAPKANVRAAEGAGTTTLTTSDARHQIFTVTTGSRIVVLPGSGVKKGEVWIIEGSPDGGHWNTGPTITVRASNGSDITKGTSGATASLRARDSYVVLIADSDNPTTPAGWYVLRISGVTEGCAMSANFDASDSVAVNASPGPFVYAKYYSCVGQHTYRYVNSNGTTLVTTANFTIQDNTTTVFTFNVGQAVPTGYNGIVTQSFHAILAAPVFGTSYRLVCDESTPAGAWDAVDNNCSLSCCPINQ